MRDQFTSILRDARELVEVSELKILGTSTTRSQVIETIAALVHEYASTSGASNTDQLMDEAERLLQRKVFSDGRGFTCGWCIVDHDGSIKEDSLHPTRWSAIDALRKRISTTDAQRYYGSWSLKFICKYEPKKKPNGPDQ